MTTPSTADSFLKTSHVSRTRHAHQVIAAALYILIDKAYKTYREDVDEEEKLKSFSDQRDILASGARKSTMSLRIAYASLSAHHSYIYPIFEGRELSTLKGYLPIASAVFFCFRSHQLREMAASSYSRYGMS